MKKALITGVSGFVGSHLLKQLLKGNKYQLFGTYIAEKSLDNISEFKNKISVINIDLNNKNKVLSLIKDIKPDFIFHLAAYTSPADSFEFARDVIVNNITAELNILDAVNRLKLLETRILITSSAEIYGIVKKEDLPIDEETSLNPTSPYAVSKIAQDYLALQYFLSYKVQSIRVRPFNHIGPKQSANFVVSSFAKKIAEIEKRKIGPILTTGNLDSKRDFTDVRDIVRAYDLIIENGKAGDVYNLGSGEAHQIKKILEMLLLHSKTKITIKSDKSLFRPVDNPELVCDCTKIKKVISWEPEILIEKTLKDTLDYWRNII